MTNAVDYATLEFGLADRLAKALSVSKTSSTEMAEALHEKGRVMSNNEYPPEVIALYKAALELAQAVEFNDRRGRPQDAGGLSTELAAFREAQQLLMEAY